MSLDEDVQAATCEDKKPQKMSQARTRNSEPVTAWDSEVPRSQPGCAGLRPTVPNVPGRHKAVTGYAYACKRPTKPKQ